MRDALLPALHFLNRTDLKSVKSSKADSAFTFGPPTYLDYSLLSGKKLGDATFDDIIEQIELNIVNETGLTEDDIGDSTFRAFSARDGYAARRLAILACPEMLDEALVSLSVLSQFGVKTST
jgi:hypothetical protein